uniref:hypothetical protein n=1 Tax=Listeria welshimeri TaxID=1643 RepID=UPI003204998D
TLQTPFKEVAQSLPNLKIHVGFAKNDDPALALVYANLRDWSLQTIQGASRISAQTEFNVGSFTVA